MNVYETDGLLASTDTAVTKATADANMMHKVISFFIGIFSFPIDLALTLRKQQDFSKTVIPFCLPKWNNLK
jgi:uncharacterized membrane protein YhaH (DUF805 family)